MPLRYHKGIGVILALILPPVHMFPIIMIVVDKLNISDPHTGEN